MISTQPQAQPVKGVVGPGVAASPVTPVAPPSDPDFKRRFHLVLKNAEHLIELERQANGAALDLPDLQGVALALHFNSPSRATHVLAVNDMNIYFIHAPVLMQHSEFFNGMLGGAFAEAGSRVVRCSLPFPVEFKVFLYWCYSGVLPDAAVTADGFKIGVNAKYLACDDFLEMLTDRLSTRWEKLNLDEMARGVPTLMTLEIGTDAIRKAPPDFERRATMLIDLADSLTGTKPDDGVYWRGKIDELIAHEYNLTCTLTEYSLMKLMSRHHGRRLMRELRAKFWAALRSLLVEPTAFFNAMDIILDKDFEVLLPTSRKRVAAIGMVKVPMTTTIERVVKVGDYEWYCACSYFFRFRTPAATYR
ncbi:hypothetical protein HK101_006173 [Irineochytrium annulatum]|nr:hypothetical protein HK101_006173 [Irineochytrium annulatum]